MCAFDVGTDTLTVNPAMLSPLVTDAFQLACERVRQRAEQNQEEPRSWQNAKETEDPLRMESESACSGTESDTGRWFHVSDTHVTEVALDAVLRAQAYILFYERIV